MLTEPVAPEAEVEKVTGAPENAWELLKVMLPDEAALAVREIVVPALIAPPPESCSDGPEIASEVWVAVIVPPLIRLLPLPINVPRIDAKLSEPPLARFNFCALKVRELLMSPARCAALGTEI